MGRGVGSGVHGAITLSSLTAIFFGDCVLYERLSYHWLPGHAVSLDFFVKRAPQHNADAACKAKVLFPVTARCAGWCKFLLLLLLQK